MKIDQNNPYGRFEGVAHYRNGEFKGIGLCGDKINKNQSKYYNDNTNYCKKCEDIIETFI